MHLTVITHKKCWRADDSPTGFVTDGGFPLQMEAISELFSSTELVVPCETRGAGTGVSPVRGKSMRVTPISMPKGKRFVRKLGLAIWLLSNGPTIWRSVRKADAVHTPIPGDVGTFGMIFALLLRKRLFVRHCGNWLEPRSIAEKIWKWSLIKLAGNRIVVFATGGADEPPSKRNPNIRWIFSTSVRNREISEDAVREYPTVSDLRLIVVCRQEPRKGTIIAIEAMPGLIERFEKVSLDVVGDGSELERLRRRSKELGLNGSVNFHGKVPQAEVKALLERAHIFCFPTSASEGFPKVVIEALAAGLPVVTTRVSVLPKLIENGGGILLDEPTPDSLANAVAEIWSDPCVFTRLSSEAVRTTKEYSLEEWGSFIGRSLRASWELGALDDETLESRREAYQ
ncbi:MAG: glycosyltransferase [Acidobacteria bacterium]|nr:MAG: glycosyltransferase [Acidobacteriota bacterium]REK01485.1 MAG: glycosyltransferase [Acidobacteriota bacterium]REK14441.1 MAG: glycosyltransferase [Acidobacteriota bacterium]REK45156.1 MAG: glycosyltransferase [Acidobacteriota bacterium]